MATDKYPNQNINYPAIPSRVAAARARLIHSTVGALAPYSPPPQDGRGSRREIRPGEWVDDRIIKHDAVRAWASPESPPELKPEKRLAPGSFDPQKVYSVQLSKAAVFAGRMLPPGDEYIMAGYAAAAVADAIVSATMLGDIPADPDVEPSEG